MGCCLQTGISDSKLLLFLVSGEGDLSFRFKPALSV